MNQAQALVGHQTLHSLFLKFFINFFRGTVSCFVDMISTNPSQELLSHMKNILNLKTRNLLSQKFLLDPKMYTAWYYPKQTLLIQSLSQLHLWYFFLIWTQIVIFTNTLFMQEVHNSVETAFYKCFRSAGSI